MRPDEGWIYLVVFDGLGLGYVMLVSRKATGRELKSSGRFLKVNFTEHQDKGHIKTLPHHSNAPQYKHRQVTQTQNFHSLFLILGG